MRTRFRCLAAGLALGLLWAATAAHAQAEAPAPTCAEGPRPVGTTMVGTPCDDHIVVPAGATAVEGGAGDDVILAPRSAADGSCPEGCRLGVGSQTFDGGPGNDVVYGERGNDVLRGGEGNDRLYGGIGDDRLEGGPGNDFLSGGFGADGIDGQAGADFVRGDGTQDELADSGPAGEVDTLSYALGATPGFADNAGYPTFSAHTGFPAAGGERGVYLDLAADVADNGVAPRGGGVDRIDGSAFERVIGTAFSDYIVGAADGLAIYGGGGADVLIGNGAGDHLDGGADGDDCVGGATTTACESTAALGPVGPRDTTKVSVGLMAAPAEVGDAELYAVGGSGAEHLTAAYSAGPPASVAFTLTAGTFDQSAGAAAGCSVGPSLAVCTLPAPLDSVLIAGMGGADQIEAASFPTSVSVGLLGGAGGDSLGGGEASEDMLVDGPGDDTLSSLGGDDIDVNNDGLDQVLGGGGNDLFLSDSICEGDVLNGGEGRDNASWAKFKAGVEARVGAGDAGRPGPGGAPECGGGSFDSLQLVEDLEGTSSADVLVGGADANQLLGHQGPDVYFAEAGDDSILANSADFDPTIDCGEGTDSAVIDLAKYGDVAAPNCESVREGAPNEFRTESKLPPAVAPPPPAIAPSNRFRVTRVVRDRRRGLARLVIRLPAAGRIALRGGRVVAASRRAQGAATVSLPVRARPRLAKAMRKGLRRALVSVTLTFDPTGGTPLTVRRALTLLRSRAARRP
jgi:Ca2+-binding RTX toxin-like protein